MDPLHRRENERALAAALGIPDEDASRRLEVPIQVTWPGDDETANSVAHETISLLRRTFINVGTVAEPRRDAVAELCLQNAAPSSTGAVVGCLIDERGATFGTGPGGPVAAAGSLPPILQLLVACFAAPRVADLALNLKKNPNATFRLDFDEWLQGRETFDEPVNLSMHLAGAGAVGSALVYAASKLPIRGRIVIIDPKPVTGGVLNRCLCFCEDDLKRPKAECLAAWLNKRQLSFVADPFVGTVDDYRTKNPGVELEMLVSAIDSRGGRRQLQDELAFTVFDASTTGIDEVVFHKNRLGTHDACMACVYPETPGEKDFETHVARKLHVSVVEVRTGYISRAAAVRIVKHYPALSLETVVGMAYDSLFKQLCATQQLEGPEQKQVLAPFGFVSQLAGTILAIEIYLDACQRQQCLRYNYWRVSPWHGPNYDLRAQRVRSESCRTCGDSVYQATAAQIWGAVMPAAPTVSVATGPLADVAQSGFDQVASAIPSP